MVNVVFSFICYSKMITKILLSCEGVALEIQQFYIISLGRMFVSARKARLRASTSEFSGHDSF